MRGFEVEQPCEARVDVVSEHTWIKFFRTIDKVLVIEFLELGMICSITLALRTPGTIVSRIPNLIGGCVPVVDCSIGAKAAHDNDSVVVSQVDDFSTSSLSITGETLWRTGMDN